MKAIKVNAMTAKVTKKGETIRNRILDLFKLQGALTFSEIFRDTKDLNLSESAIRKHVANLVEQHCLTSRKNAQGRLIYSLWDSFTKMFSYDLKNLDPNRGDESMIWIKDIKPLMTNQNKSCVEILDIGFNEIFNNAMSHSNGSSAHVYVTSNAIHTKIIVQDDGVGIFKKIKEGLNLPDERQSLLELSKGKMTTAAKDHSGEGIFFVSKACDFFAIASSDLVFSHDEKKALDLLEQQNLRLEQGTIVVMLVNNNTSHDMRSVYNDFRDQDCRFSRTLVPVRLLRYQDEGIVSRAQARRLMARVDRFQHVCLDFEGIDFIGQGFADEIFRVYAASHPDMEITTRNAGPNIKAMISHVTAP